LKQAYVRLSERQEAMQLPIPQGSYSVENVFFAPTIPGATGPVPYTLKGVSFALEPGDVLAIIGPSAAGKSSLAKLMVGVWKAMQGNVRLDGADVYTWNREDFGKHIGYLPQDIELFSGSIKDNIARLNENADPADIVEAAKMTGAHDLILRLKNGYETDIGIGGANLSGGQRQRIGLARAFYGNPKLIVLDEPNANLDELGEQALVGAIKHAKEKKITTVIISHRPSILSSVDKILILQDGSVAAFGTRDEIMAKFSKPANVPAAQ
jgi:ATP-binding cassette subfamily C protein